MKPPVITSIILAKVIALTLNVQNVWQDKQKIHAMKLEESLSIVQFFTVKSWVPENAIWTAQDMVTVL